MTSPVVTSSIGMSPMCGNANRAIPNIQSRLYLALLHPGRTWVQTRSAAAAKVRFLARRLSARGSPPARASLRLARASTRASCSETSGKLPRPISRRRPRMTRRCTQLRVPDGCTSRYSPWPSQ